MAMEAPKLPQQLQGLGQTAPLHDLPSPSRRRSRGKSESPEKKGSAAKGISDRKAFYDDAETTLEEARNQCSELQDRIARFQEQMQLERSIWRKRLEDRARGRMRPQEDEDDDKEKEHRAKPEEVPTELTEQAGEEQGQSRDLCGGGELTLRIPAVEAEPQPDESEPILQRRKQRHQSSDTDNQSEARSRRRARRHSEPAVRTRRQSLEVPGLVAEDDMISPSGEAFVKSLGRRFQEPVTPSCLRQQPDMRRRHSAPPTPEPTADLDAELSAPEPRKGMLTKLINFFTPQWMRDDVVYDYAQIRRSQSRRRAGRRSGQQAASVQEKARTGERVAVYASQR